MLRNQINGFDAKTYEKRFAQTNLNNFFFE